MKKTFIQSVYYTNCIFINGTARNPAAFPAELFRLFRQHFHPLWLAALEKKEDFPWKVPLLGARVKPSYDLVRFLEISRTVTAAESMTTNTMANAEVLSAVLTLPESGLTTEV